MFTMVCLFCKTVTHEKHLDLYHPCDDIATNVY